MINKSLKFAVALLFAAVCCTQAIEFIQTNQFTVVKGASISNETWVSAQTVTINGTAVNDLFTTAQAVDLNGTFTGDVWSFGNNITAAGIFQNDVRLISKTAQIFGTIHGSVIASGTTVKIDRTAQIYGDLLCIGENIIIEGLVSGNVKILSPFNLQTRVTLGGKINGDVTIEAQDIVVLPGTILNGNLTYTAPGELVLPPAQCWKAHYAE